MFRYSRKKKEEMYSISAVSFIVLRIFVLYIYIYSNRLSLFYLGCDVFYQYNDKEQKKRTDSTEGAWRKKKAQKILNTRNATFTRYRGTHTLKNFHFFFKQKSFFYWKKIIRWKNESPHPLIFSILLATSPYIQNFGFWNSARYQLVLLFQ